MRALLRRLWPLFKALLAVAILAGVTWQFVRVLNDPALKRLDPSRSAADILWGSVSAARPGWLLLGAGYYLAGLGFYAGFWIALLYLLGQRPSKRRAVRAYFISHLGKYIPGKAWALLLRTTLSSGPGVRPGVAALTATYETLTTMAAGALLAAVLFTWQVGGGEGMAWRALGLLALAGIPILPGVFNPLVRRLSAPFREPDAPPLPRLRAPTLLAGLGLTGCGWFLFGASLWAVVRAVHPDPPPASPETWVRYTAYVSLAYVAGFLALPAPGGLGVREFLLHTFLAAEFAGPEHGATALVVVLLLRLLWTAAEVGIAGVLYWLPGRREATKKEGEPAGRGEYGPVPSRAGGADGCPPDADSP